jgi:hypothetical protein
METNRFDHNDAATILASGLIYALQTKPPSRTSVVTSPPSRTHHPHAFTITPVEQTALGIEHHLLCCDNIAIPNQ